MQSSNLFKNHTFEEIKVFFKTNNLCYLGHSKEDQIKFDFKNFYDSISNSNKFNDDKFEYKELILL